MSVYRLSSKMSLLFYILILGSTIINIDASSEDIFHKNYENYRELRLQHLKRHRRQQPKEISISLTAPLFTSRLFDFGPDVGDQELPSGVDIGVKIDLKNPFKYNSQVYQSVFVLGNGGIAFEPQAKIYHPSIFSKDTDTLPMIVPFWNKNDLRKGGHVWFREVTSGRILERGQSEIRYQYDKNVKVLSCLLVTWDRMQPLGNSVLDEENANIFQAAIFFTANYTYVNFIYNNIGWTQGAEAGFVSNRHVSDFTLPTSGTENIMYLEEYGNTGIPGEWMFELQPQRVVRCKSGIKGDICDEECSKGEYGEDCIQCCHCGNGEICNPLTGQCPTEKCDDCWYGATCNLKDAVCSEKERNSCVRNAVAYISMNNCNEQIVECNCLQGYEGDGKVECVDVDECKQPGICHENAICTNTPGHYICECMDGFTGDGVTECVASFLFPYEGHQELPKSKNAKVSFTLKHPLLIFGKQRDKLIVSNTGLIIVEEFSKVHSNDKLDDMNVVGIAPFYSPIDLSRNGKITIAETTSEDVLLGVTNKINENLDEPNFEATNVVIITYLNVSSVDSKDSNTFQGLIIGGRTNKGEIKTFTMMLYKDLIWSTGAEAGIMAFEKSNSIHLPGSGTAGIEQLSQLSNIRLPGVWLYRIDKDVVHSCMKLELQPPYCDAESPTLVNSHKKLNQKTTTSFKPKNPEVASNKKETISPSSINELTNQITSGKTKISTIKQSTEHRPIVSIDPKDFDDLPDDAFDAVTFPPFVTVVPQIFNNEQQKNIQPETQKPSMPRVVYPQTTTTTTTTTTTVISSTENIVPEVVITSTESSKEYKSNVDFSNNEEIDFVPVTDVVSTRRPSSKNPLPVVISKNLPEKTQHNKNTLEINTSTNPATIETSSSSIKIFPTSTKLPKQITKVPKAKPVEYTTQSNSDILESEDNQVLEAESSTGNRAATLVLVTIVVFWLLLLIIIGAVCCCRKRRAIREFHPMYGPSFGGQPIATAFAMRKASQGYDTSSYEDSLEKSARLSAEMNSYNRQGRISLYGSYWNLTGGNLLTTAPITSCSELLASSSSNTSPVESAITTARATPNNSGRVYNNHHSNIHQSRYGYGPRY